MRVHEGACFQSVNSSPTTRPYPMKPFSIERPLTLLPIGHNLAVNGSELSDKDGISSIRLSKRERGGRLVWWGIRLGQNTPIAAGGASHHRDLLGDPVHFWVMEGEPGVSYDHRLLSEVCGSKMRSFGMASKVKSDMDFLHD